MSKIAMPSHRNRTLNGMLLTVATLVTLLNPTASLANAEIDAYYQAALLAQKSGKHEDAKRLLEAALKSATDQNIADLSVASVLELTANNYVAQKKYSEAKTFYQKALAIRELKAGSENLLVAECLSGLADCSLGEGKFAEAIALYQRALFISEKDSGNGNHSIIPPIKKLAKAYALQKKYELAEALYKRALEISRQKFGLNSLPVAESLNDLAFLYFRQDKWSQQLDIIRQELSIRKTFQKQGKEIARCLYGIALCLKNLGHDTESAEAYRSALIYVEKTFGVEDERLILILGRLGGFCIRQGNNTQAETYIKRAYTLAEKKFKDKPTYKIQYIDDLAYVYQLQKRYSESEKLYKQSLEIAASSQYKWEGGDTLTSLADLYCVQKRYTEAEDLYNRALSKLIPGLANYENCLINLASLYELQENYEKAKPLYQKILKLREDAYKPNKKQLAISQQDYGRICFLVGNFSEAENFLLKALKANESSDFSKNQLSSCLNDLAHMYDLQERFSDAETFANRSITAAESSNQPNTMVLTTSIYQLSSIYLHQRKYQQAELLDRRALSICEQAYGNQDPRIITSLEIVASLNGILKQFKNAQEATIRALGIEEKKYGEASIQVADRLNTLGLYYFQDGNVSLAESTYKRSFTTFENLKQTDAEKFSELCSNYARLLRSLNRFDEASVFELKAVVRNKEIEDKKSEASSSAGQFKGYYCPNVLTSPMQDDTVYTPVGDGTIISRGGTSDDGASFKSDVEFSANLNDKVYCLLDGIVTKVGPNADRGITVEIYHPYPDVRTTVGHLNAWAVLPGMPVQRGRVIGYAGQTGNVDKVCLSYTVIKEDTGEFIDPYEFIKATPTYTTEMRTAKEKLAR